MDRSLNTLCNPKRYPKIKYSVYLSNYWLELWYQLGKFYLLPFKFFNCTKNTNASKQAVLLIHGYGRNSTDWLWIRKQLKGMPVFAVNLRPSFAPIQEIANNSIPPMIEKIKKKTNCEKIILITHSMGGLVGSYYSEYLDKENIIDNLITIAAPFHGTKISIMGYGENAKQMCPGSHFLTELRHKIHVSHRNYYEIGTEFENLLFPWDSCFLPDTPQTHKLVIKDVAHLSLLHDESVALQLNTWLAKIIH